jgi:DNA-binding MarR family transcriptional regulator
MSSRTSARPDRVIPFMQRMWAVVHELQRVSKRMEAELRLTGPQRVALLMIGRSPGLSAGELAAQLHLHPATLTGVLARLEAARLIHREWDRGDARRMRLALTNAGRVANRKRSGTVESAVRDVLSRTSTADAAVATRVLAGLASALQSVAGQGLVRARVPRRVARAYRGVRRPRIAGLR